MMTPVYQSLSTVVTPARAHNAKAKVIEPFFKELNRNFCQYKDNWAGFGVTADKDKQPNTELLNKFRHSFPNREGCAAQLRSIVEALRSERREQYLSLWNKVEDTQKLPLELADYLYYFGDVRYDRKGEIIKNSLTGSGVLATIGGVERSYDCFDLQFRRQGKEKWILRYDPSDVSRVLATNEAGTLRYMLEEKYVQPMALAERKEGDSAELQRIHFFNKNELMTYITEFRAHTGDTVRALFSDNPQLNDTLTKHLLADSRGQHKDRLNCERMLSAGQKLDIKYAKRQEQDEERSFSEKRKQYVKNKLLMVNEF
jgi:hypothetical protein